MYIVFTFLCHNNKLIEKIRYFKLLLSSLSLLSDICPICNVCNKIRRVSLWEKGRGGAIFQLWPVVPVNSPEIDVYIFTGVPRVKFSGWFRCRCRFKRFILLSRRDNSSPPIQNATPFDRATPIVRENRKLLAYARKKGRWFFSFVNQTRVDVQRGKVKSKRWRLRC